MHAQTFKVRWCFIATCVLISLSFVWMVKMRGRTSNWSRQKLDAGARLSPPATNRVLSTRSAMIEKQLGRPLVVDPDMPYIGYLKPGEWRKYNLPEGIGIGRGSKGKQRNKFGQKTKNTQMGKSKVKTNKGQGRDDVDPNQLFFNIELDKEVEANIVAKENVGQLENIEEEQEDGEDEGEERKGDGEKQEYAGDRGEDDGQWWDGS